MHPWWSEDVMKKTTTPDKSMTAYLAFQRIPADGVHTQS
jgi:hypothetical protein